MITVGLNSYLLELSIFLQHAENKRLARPYFDRFNLLLKLTFLDGLTREGQYCTIYFFMDPKPPLSFDGDMFFPFQLCKTI